MPYYSGSVAAVPAANRDAYLEHIRRAWPLMREQGVTRMVETWGEDVPHGKRTDFHRAVQAQDDEVPVFSWMEWPDRATCDAAFQRMMADDSFSERMGEMPFDGKRMIFGGFAPLTADGTDRGAGWFQGFLLAVPADKRDAYAQMAREAHEQMFAPNGCLGTFENWGEDVPRGKLTDMYRAVEAEDGEMVVFSWTAWPDRATCESAAKAMEASMQGQEMPEMPFDGQRMMWGGFAPIFDSDRDERGAP